MGMIVVSTSLVPYQWRINGTGWAVILPLSIVCGCHILFPVSWIPFRWVQALCVALRAFPLFSLYPHLDNWIFWVRVYSHPKNALLPYPVMDFKMGPRVHSHWVADYIITRFSRAQH
ncbi:hypothetical protein EDD17DRAFT_941146 [Pisolithus thermaeus]|nr:hypothetical protein EDD17DRAFT_941146 [Pisolithus thermaeus]